MYNKHINLANYVLTCSFVRLRKPTMAWRFIKLRRSMPKYIQAQSSSWYSNTTAMSTTMPENNELFHGLVVIKPPGGKQSLLCILLSKSVARKLVACTRRTHLAKTYFSVSCAIRNNCCRVLKKEFVLEYSNLAILIVLLLNDKLLLENNFTVQF